MILLLVGCASEPADRLSNPAPRGGANPGSSGERQAAASSRDQTVALLDDRPVSWSDLRGPLIEAAGGRVFGEWVLDRKIEGAVRTAGLTISEDAIERERDLLLEQLGDDPNQATRLLAQLREQRGLGTARFSALLRRNAALRALVAGEVELTESMVREAHEQRYGERAVARLILVPTLNEASRVMRRIGEGEPFTELAIEVSRDSSRDQGGLLPPISEQDATFPRAIRDAVRRLDVGEVSEPVALDSGFAILRKEREIEAQPIEFETVADELRRDVRLQVERNLMQRRARVLMQEAEVTVLDPELNRAWQRQRRDLLDQE